VTATPVSSPAPLPGAGVPPGDIDGQPSPPPPRAGVSIVAEPATGKVLIQLPGRTAFIRLPDAELIPLKSVIDARNGSVLLTAAGKGGSAKFSEGIFKVTQAPGVAPLTTLTLVGGDFKACPPIPKRARATAKRKLKKTSSVRHLWGDGSGNFRTVGRYASATLRGTRWLTDDRCDGTLVRVAKGRVSVRDLVKKKTVALKAPKSYVARP
jgi:hypothetical protein